MLITIENKQISLTVDTLGAQMMSIRGADGCEYLWQGDPVYWDDRSPTLFPFIGRLQNSSYLYHGKSYPMSIHGFAAELEFSPEEQTEDKVVLSLSSSIATLVRYPFDFTFEVTYQLKGSTVEIASRVRNQSGETMPFALGGHPGFRVPLTEGEVFEDYYLEFSQNCAPEQILFSPATVLACGKVPYTGLEEGRRMPLTHGLFDADAIILEHAAREVSLKSRTGNRSVTVSYPDMAYIGFWQWPGKDAPYVCIEPWTSLPGRDGIAEEISCRSDFIQLAPGKIYENIWTITVNQEVEA